MNCVLIWRSYIIQLMLGLFFFICTSLEFSFGWVVYASLSFAQGLWVTRHISPLQAVKNLWLSEVFKITLFVVLVYFAIGFQWAIHWLLIGYGVSALAASLVWSVVQSPRLS